MVISPSSDAELKKADNWPRFRGFTEGVESRMLTLTEQRDLRVTDSELATRFSPVLPTTIECSSRDKGI